jgi:hypothetical protein
MVREGLLGGDRLLVGGRHAGRERLHRPESPLAWGHRVLPRAHQ